MSLTIAAFATGVVFLFLLLLIGCVIAFRSADHPVSRDAMLIFRIILALAGGAFAGILTGFLDIGGKVGNLTLHAGGGLAVFLLLYHVNPPVIIDRKTRRVRSPVRIKVPGDRLE